MIKQKLVLRDFYEAMQIDRRTDDRMAQIAVESERMRGTSDDLIVHLMNR